MNTSEILKKGFLGSIGIKPNYQIINESTTYKERGLLSEEDAQEIVDAVEDYKRQRAEANKT